MQSEKSVSAEGKSILPACPANLCLGRYKVGMYLRFCRLILDLTRSGDAASSAGTDMLNPLTERPRHRPRA
jgi:hypothetical protein